MSSVPAGFTVKRLVRDYSASYLFILAALAGFLLFQLVPVVFGLIVSFQEYKVLGSAWVGLRNYRRALTDPVFWKAMKVTVLYTAGTVPVTVAIALFLAVLIYPLRKAWQTFFKASFYLPTVASGVIVTMIWLWIFEPTQAGLFNMFLGLFGVENVNWLGQSRTALLALILMTWLSSHGAGIILYLASLGSIPASLYESADIDGAGTLRKFWGITWPLLKPTTLYLVVIGVINSFQVFVSIYLMTLGGPNFATTTIAYLIYQHAFEYYDFGLAAAESFLLAIVIVTISVFQFRFLSQDVEY
jgi:multiple sugar transport system permease protein